MLCSAITPLRGLFPLYSYPCNYDLGDSISTAKPTIGDAVDLLLVFAVNTAAGAVLVFTVNTTIHPFTTLYGCSPSVHPIA